MRTSDGGHRGAGTPVGRPGAVAATTLVFDVMGTVLDEDTTQADALRAAIGSQADVDLRALRHQWCERVASAVDEITAGRRPYEPPAALQRKTLREVLDAHHLELPPDRFHQLAQFGSRLEPFPDTAAAMERLASRRAIVALTNAGSAQAFAMSAHARLRWTTLISAQVVQTYKPDPRTYSYAITQLDLDPGKTLFVAAHPWDLDAAAGHGFRTAYVDRAGSTPESMDAYAVRSDLVVTDLTALADQLQSP
jgi:2-haloacid dehalogenase